MPLPFGMGPSLLTRTKALEPFNGAASGPSAAWATAKLSNLVNIAACAYNKTV